MIINRPIGSLAIKNSGKKVYFKLRKPWEFSINLKIPLKTSIVLEKPFKFSMVWEEFITIKLFWVLWLWVLSGSSFHSRDIMKNPIKRLKIPKSQIYKSNIFWKSEKFLKIWSFWHQRISGIFFCFLKIAKNSTKIQNPDWPKITFTSYEIKFYLEAQVCVRVSIMNVMVSPTPTVAISLILADLN